MTCSHNLYLDRYTRIDGKRYEVQKCRKCGEELTLRIPERIAPDAFDSGCPYCGKIVCTCNNRDCLSLLPKDELEPTRSGY